MSRTWQKNAEEFRNLDTGEGWPFARLVACSVYIRKGSGRISQTERESLARDFPGKTNASDFATTAGATNDRVIRYLTCWQRAHAEGHVPDANTLTPDDVEGMSDPPISWLLPNRALRFGDGRTTGGRPRDSKAEDAATIVTRRGADAFVKALTKKQRADLARSLAEPDAVITALDDDEFVAKVVEEMTPEQRNHVRREVNVQEIKRIYEKRKDEPRVEKGIEEKLAEEMRDVTKNIYVPLGNVRQMLTRVNTDWNKFDGAIDLEWVRRKVSGIQDELGVLEMYVTGMPFPAENGMPE